MIKNTDHANLRKKSGEHTIFSLNHLSYTKTPISAETRYDKSISLYARNLLATMDDKLFYLCCYLLFHYNRPTYSNNLFEPNSSHKFNIEVTSAISIQSWQLENLISLIFVASSIPCLSIQFSIYPSRQGLLGDQSGILAGHLYETYTN